MRSSEWKLFVLGNSYIWNPSGNDIGTDPFSSIYFTDLPECLVNECALFADDTSAYGVGKDSSQLCSTLSLDMKAASNWAKTWGILFNAEKSEHLSITGNAQNSNSCRIGMETTKIPKVTTVHKHLGITVNSTPSWSDHIKKRGVIANFCQKSFLEFIIII